MTKKDYELIASTFKYMFNNDSKNHDKYTIESMARLQALVFSKHNPKFDRNRFLEACGVTE